MELIVTIALCAVIFTVFSSTLSASYLLRKSTFIIQASDFLREELDSLRALPFSELVNQTNGPFLGISLTRGDWKVKAMATAPSQPNALTLDADVDPLQLETGLMVIPGNYRDDFDFSAKVYVASTSPVVSPWGWGTGLVFRYRDSQNHYRLRYRSGGLALQKIVDGNFIELWSSNSAYNTNTWYTLRVVASGTSFSIYRNGTLLGTVNDSEFSVGDLGVYAFNESHVAVDDISIVEDGVTTSYNFDGDAVGSMPVDWQRFVYVDLPGGEGSLTISNYLGQSTIKQVTATVTWVENDATRTMSGSTLIAQ
jgi:hypothetical protein